MPLILGLGLLFLFAICPLGTIALLFILFIMAILSAVVRGVTDD